MTEQRASRLDVGVLTMAMHNAFGGDAPGGCHHDPIKICEEYAVEIATDYETEIVARLGVESGWTPAEHRRQHQLRMQEEDQL